mgnify:CR=1 FL=1
MGKLFRGLWAILSGISRFISVVVPLLFVGFLIFAVSQGMKEAKPQPVPEAAALMINPKGVLVEDRAAKEPLEALMVEAENREVLLSNLIRAIEEGAEDERIKVLVLDLEQLAGPSTSQAFEIAKALETFRAAGKPVVAVGDFYAQSHYLLAAQADHVLLHPLGTVMLQGFGVYRSYLREFLDNIMVNMHVFRVGENKSAVEPYLRDDMSEVERQVVERWVGGLWSDVVSSLETARELPAGSIDSLLSEFPERLKAARGDMAQLALDAGLVDQLLDHSERDDFIAALVGDRDEEGEYRQIDFDGYLFANQFPNPAADKAANKPVIAVVPVEGEIIPGESTQGMVGSETVVSQLERAASIDNLGALVLRINSPGGSVFASEVMRRKILEIKAQGVPVVVSMASVAASGGYYIAADADRIIAQPTTITGSIGVFAAFPTVERLMDYVGIHTDGVGTTPLAGSMRLDRPLDDASRQILTSVVEDIYADFIALVANGREMEETAVREIAGGKVWTGRDALEIGLVDELGTLSDAAKSAAELAGLEDWQVKRVGTPISPEQQFFEQLGRRLGTTRITEAPLLAQLVSVLSQPMAVLDSLRDPRQVYVRCLSCSSGL